ncbi:MAG: hypothetical protein ACYTGQ_06335, partial [Planctomycetota bacterium]
MSERRDAWHVGARVRGRVLVSAGEGVHEKGGVSEACCLILGFHGYAESAETMLERLETLAIREEAVLCSVQGLHPFYARGGAVGASWMTKQDRELAIEDNLA